MNEYERIETVEVRNSVKGVVKKCHCNFHVLKEKFFFNVIFRVGASFSFYKNILLSSLSSLGRRGDDNIDCHTWFIPFTVSFGNIWPSCIQM